MVEIIIVAAILFSFVAMVWFGGLLTLMGFELVDEAIGTIIWNYKWHPKWGWPVWDDKAKEALKTIIGYVFLSGAEIVLDMAMLAMLFMPLIINGNIITDTLFILYNVGAYGVSYYIMFKVEDAAETWHLEHVEDQDHDRYNPLDPPPYMEFGSKMGTLAGCGSCMAFILLEVVVLIIINYV